MAAQAHNLRAQLLSCALQVGWLPVVLLLAKTAAAPARHYQHAALVGKVEKIVGLKVSFETSGVQSHVAHILDLRVGPVGRLAHQHIGRPASASDQDSSAVDVK